MFRFKHFVTILLTLCITAGVFTGTCEASARKKITSVSLAISSDILPDTSVEATDVAIEYKGDKFSADEYEFLNQEPFWKEDSVPELKLTLTAADGYYFNVTEQNIRLEGADFVSSSKENMSQTLYITVKLEPLNEKVGAVGNVSWNGMRAEWEPAYGAGSYEIRLLKDGRPGTTLTAYSAYYDFTSSISRPGTYSYRVRPVNTVKAENKGDWAESGSIYVDAEQAARNRQSVSDANQASGWILDHNGWWYRNPDGTYQRNAWQMINGQWYYFRDDGYMATGWVQDHSLWYYCQPDGSMMNGGVTPDGYRLNGDGTWAE